MTLTIVYDTVSECHAVYIAGKLRGEWEYYEFHVSQLVECYEAFARDTPVVIERIEVDSEVLGIYDDDDTVVWPDTLGGLEL